MNQNDDPITPGQAAGIYEMAGAFNKHYSDKMRLLTDNEETDPDSKITKERLVAHLDYLAQFKAKRIGASKKPPIAIQRGKNKAASKARTAQRMKAKGKR